MMRCRFPAFLIFAAFFATANAKSVNPRHLEIHSPRVRSSNDWACGIYVPDDPARGASFYRIRPNTDTNSEMGPVVNAIIRYGYGSFDWPDKAESMELRNKLSARVT